MTSGQGIATVAGEVQGRTRMLRTLQAGLILLALVAAGCCALFALDNLLHLNAVVRVLLSLAFLGAGGMYWVRHCLKPLLNPLSREEALIVLERSMPELDNRLINAERLRRDTSTPGEIIEMIQEEAARMLAVFDLRKVAPLASLKKLAIGAGVAVAVMALYALILPEHFANAMKRYAQPTAFIAPITRTHLKVLPGDVTLLEGDTLTVRAEIGGEMPNDARVRTADATQVMRFVGNGFMHEFAGVESSFTYSVEAGDAVSDRFKVTVLKRCRVEKMALTFMFPDYLKQAPRTDDPSSGAVSVVEGTRVHATLKTSKPVLSLSGVISPGMAIERKDDGWDFIATLNGSYSFTWTDTDKLEGKSAAYPITALKDQPPIVKLLEPVRDTHIQPNGSVTVVVQATDDFGLAGVELKMRKGDKPPVTVATFPVTGRQMRSAYLLKAEDLKAKLGEAFGVFAVAKDLKGQEAVSGVVGVHIVADATLKQEILKEVKTIAARLREVIEEQKRVKGLTSLAKPGVEELVKAQVAIRKTLKDIHSEWDNQDLIHLTARQKLEGVLSGPATKVIGLLRGDIPGALQSQGEIIAQLEAIARQLEGVVVRSQTAGVQQALTEATEKTPKQIAKDLLAGLKDFETEQKKVLQETMDLKLKASEDFTTDDKKKLETLKQTEEKWGKFFQEKTTDLSRLSPQDQTNGTSSKELNEIASEIKQAAEKLDKKATELAIPLEEGGLELAKSIESNIEKFLAGASDDTKWNMEDNNKDVDVPMQDLPAELEDIIGDLIDKEDKLAEEAQDVTSNWLDSMDKGVGWGVSDGPISDMSAKGITGNVNPNDNEVNGRSGEGRSGKSSGQFAEKTADGKGGKQTPTRSTPDPFEAGRVDDKSKDPSGGSTGGGKISGANKEGLRGEPPPLTKEKMDRLANAQADLRNQAEKANVGMQKRGYVAQDLVAAINKMKTVEGKLRAHSGMNYTGEMKGVAEKLKATNKTVRDSIDVSHDTAQPLTQQRRNDIRNAMDEPVPSEFKDWVKEYYKALSK